MDIWTSDDQKKTSNYVFKIPLWILAEVKGANCVLCYFFLSLFMASELAWHDIRFCFTIITTYTSSLLNITFIWLIFWQWIFFLIFSDWSDDCILNEFPWFDFEFLALKRTAAFRDWCDFLQCCGNFVVGLTFACHFDGWSIEPLLQSILLYSI